MSGYASLLATRKTGRLTINSILMHIPGCWTIYSPLTPLWLPPPKDFENLSVPRQEGTRPFRQRNPQAQHDLGLVVVGTHNRLGAPYSDKMVGLETNMKYLVDNLPLVANSAPTVSASIVKPSTTVVNAEIQVIGWVLDEPTDDMQTGQLTIVIPAGRFS